MSATPTPEPNDDVSPAEDARYYRAVLHELIDMGMDAARKVHADIVALQPEPAQPDQPAYGERTAAIADFDRISRCVRRTVLLARHVATPVAPSAAQRRACSRKQLIRAVEDAIHDSGRSPAHMERLQREFEERLDAPDLDEDLANRPLPEVVAEVCRDLGISGPPGPQLWKRRTPSDVAALCARAARPSRPQPAPAPQPPAPSSPDRGHDPERIHRLIAVPNDG